MSKEQNNPFPWLSEPDYGIPQDRLVFRCHVRGDIELTPIQCSLIAHAVNHLYSELGNSNEESNLFGLTHDEVLEQLEELFTDYTDQFI